VRGIGIVLAVAVLPIAATAVVAEDTPAGAEASVVDPHIFNVNEDGLISNRRPANVTFLGVSDRVVRAEDSREATAGADAGFAVQPAPNSLQQVIAQATWGAAHAGEVVDTATGFLTNYTSPELVVLRGASGRWTDRGATPPPTSLTWHGEQRSGFSLTTDIPLPPEASGEVPVGVEIVNNRNDDRYVLLATDRALYAFTGAPTGPSNAMQFTLRSTQRYAATERVLGIHHSPLWAASAAEQFEATTFRPELSEAVGVLLATTQQLGPAIAPNTLFVQLRRFSVSGAVGSTNVGANISISSLGSTVGSAGDVVTGADLRFSIAQRLTTPLIGQAGLPVSYEVRADVNITISRNGERSTQQWAGRNSSGGSPPALGSLVPPPEVVLVDVRLGRVNASTCASPATGFDVAYFRAATTTGGGGQVLEAHVMCAAPTQNGTVQVGGYLVRLSESWGTRAIPQTIIDRGASGAPVQPQISLNFPCLDQLRFELRLQNPQQSPGLSPTNLLQSLRSDAEFMRSRDNWRTTFRCSANPNLNQALSAQREFTHAAPGNVQATVSVPLAAAGSNPLGNRSGATTTELVSRSLVVPAPRFDWTDDGLPNLASLTIPPISWRTVPGGGPAEMSSSLNRPGPAGFAPGYFLTRLPSTDVVELVRLIGDTESCGVKPPNKDFPAAVPDPNKPKGDRLPGVECRPQLAFGAPVPIAVLQAPPFVRGTGQSPPAVSEFANGTSATQEVSQFTSSSVGGELEVSVGGNASLPLIGGVEVTGTVALGYERGVEASTAESLTVSKITGYAGASDNDTVITNNGRYLEYTGVVVEDSVGINTNDKAVIRVPIGNTVTSQTISDLLADPNTARWWGGDGPFAPGIQEILSHVPGMPNTYLGNSSANPDADLNEYCLGSLDPRQGLVEVRRGTPAAADPGFTPRGTLDRLPQILTGSWAAVLAGNDVTAQRTNLEFGREFSDSFLSSHTVSASVSLEVKKKFSAVEVGVKPTLSAAGSWGNSFSASLGTDTSFSGVVGSLPDRRLGPVEDPNGVNEQFEWRMFVCKKEVTPGVPIWVQGYQVRNYNGVYDAVGAKAPEDLGSVAVVQPRQSRTVSTTPRLTWQQPEGTVKDYTVELEAVGRFDPREFTAPPVDGAGRPVSGWPETSLRAENTSFTVPQTEELLPNQLYRWRVVSNNFFYKSEPSPWEFFVTDGRPSASFEIPTFPGFAVAGSNVEIVNTSNGNGLPFTATWFVDDQQVASTTTGNTDRFTWTPRTVGPAVIKLVVTNEKGSSTTTRTVLVVPDAVDDSYRTDEDRVLTVDAPGVLENDTGAVIGLLERSTSRGALDFFQTGAFQWRPPQRTCGADAATAFQYRPYGGSGGGLIPAQRAATVAIEVECVDDPPTAVGDAFPGTEGEPIVVNAPGVLANDEDTDLADGEQLTAVLVRAPRNGEVALNEDGSFTYTPRDGTCAVDDFTYRVDNGQVQGSVATVTLGYECAGEPDPPPTTTTTTTTVPPSSTTSTTTTTPPSTTTTTPPSTTTTTTPPPSTTTTPPPSTTTTTTTTTTTPPPPSTTTTTTTPPSTTTTVKPPPTTVKPPPTTVKPPPRPCPRTVTRFDSKDRSTATALARRCKLQLYSTVWRGERVFVLVPKGAFPCPRPARRVWYSPERELSLIVLQAKCGYRPTSTRPLLWHLVAWDPPRSR
jgi:hypothetical protein